MFDKHDVEEIILVMADIVMENRDLRAELARAQRLQKEHDKFVDDLIKGQQKADKDLLKMLLEHALMGEGNMNETTC